MFRWSKFSQACITKNPLKVNTFVRGQPSQCPLPPSSLLQVMKLGTKEILKSRDSLCHVSRHQGGYHANNLVFSQMVLVFLHLSGVMSAATGNTNSVDQFYEKFSWPSIVEGPTFQLDFLHSWPPLPPEYTSPRPRKRSRKNFTGHVFYQSHQPPLLQVLKNPFTTFRPSNSSSLSYQPTIRASSKGFQNSPIPSIVVFQ